MALAVVRSIDAPRRLASAQDEDDYEQELVDQYLLASMGAACRDSTLASDRSVLFEFARFLGRPVWTASASDADRYLANQRKALCRSYSTVHGEALALGNFFDFLVVRHQGDIHALTGHVVAQVIDEYNRPASPDYGSAPVPPGDEDVETLFTLWRQDLPNARKFLIASRSGDATCRGRNRPTRKGPSVSR